MRGRAEFVDAEPVAVDGEERLELILPGDRPWYPSGVWDGYAYEGPASVWLSLLICAEPGRGHFSRLCGAIWALGKTVVVPCPIGAMPAILRAKGFVLDGPGRGHPVPVWRKPPAGNPSPSEETATMTRKPKQRANDTVGGGHFVVRRHPDGRIGPSKTPFEHPSLEVARGEAERLAKVHPGQTFVVLSQSFAVRAEETR